MNNIKPPYCAVIFTADQTADKSGYKQMSERLYALAQTQPGFLGIESVDGDFEITISYWKDLESIAQWKAHTEHLKAQKLRPQKWYKNYKVRITKVEREY
tara:strand:+ start:981 stop:1280 length:300 start_codon:yes stop_codon:yes gene_type:complete